MYLYDPRSYEGDKMLLQLSLESLYERLTSAPEHIGVVISDNNKSVTNNETEDFVHDRCAKKQTAIVSEKKNNKKALYEFLNETTSSKYAGEAGNVVPTRISIKMEMNCFAQTGIKGKMLTFIDSAVNTVRPSSIEPERTFSTAGRTQNKVRNRMSTKLLDAIIVLRYYLRNSK